ncbi:MAG: RNA polymerase sigma factor [Acidimicrobiaceae bacterium]|nr:RNA polymerase sigma factor [Acidimicrobiaceae bacterium]
MRPIGLDRADGSAKAFLEATLPHLDIIYRVAFHTAHDHHRAEDLVQETYLRAYAAFAGHHGTSTRAWLVTICLNLARSESRRRSRRVVEAPLPDDDIAPAANPPVTDLVIAGLERERVTRALAQLPEEQRLAIVLMDLAGQTAAEVAGQLGCSRNTVLSRVHRGHRRLAGILAREDVDHGL